jgi:cullin-associated NEDD8-dissociated protein 1
MHGALVAAQVLKEGAPGVAAGGETRKQQWCCPAKGLQHFDISY